jgi:hypothetical protein
VGGLIHQAASSKNRSCWSVCCAGDGKSEKGSGAMGQKKSHLPGRDR